MKKRGRKVNNSEKTKTKIKAQGEIITTVLIILLVLAAVVIVWNVVKGTIDKAAAQVDVKPMLLQGDVRYGISSGGNVLTTNVERKPGGGDISGVVVLLEIDGNSYKYQDTTTIPKELETKPFTFSCGSGILTGLASGCMNNLKKVSIAFLYKDNKGNDVPTDVVGSSTSPTSNVLPVCSPDCTSKACGDDDGCGHPCLTGSCPAGETCGGTGICAIEISNCGPLVSGKNYRLINNVINVQEGTNCFTLDNKNNINLDLNGFTISGKADSSLLAGYAINAVNSQNIIIKNGKFNNFALGLQLDSVSYSELKQIEMNPFIFTGYATNAAFNIMYSDNLILENLKSDKYSLGLILDNSNYVTVKDSEFLESLDVGIYFIDSSDNILNNIKSCNSINQDIYDGNSNLNNNNFINNKCTVISSYISPVPTYCTNSC